MTSTGGSGMYSSAERCVGVCDDLWHVVALSEGRGLKCSICGSAEWGGGGGEVWHLW